MSFTEISSQKLGEHEQCAQCHAGNTVSVNWQYLSQSKLSGIPKSKSIFINQEALKSGCLYQCKSCSSNWYLDEDKETMSFVENSLLPLIRKWNDSTISLSQSHLKALLDIKQTPYDLYGNGSQYVQFPCEIKTTSGEVIPLAIVSFQKHPPFESWRNNKLATDIREISPSQFALPFEIREETSKAAEIRMGFAPTVVKLSNNEKVILNWTQSFIKMKGINTSETKLCKERIDTENMPDIYNLDSNITYFIVDPDPFVQAAFKSTPSQENRVSFSEKVINFFRLSK
jgi:hypothetical protein